jgi:hypothetical protein
VQEGRRWTDVLRVVPDGWFSYAFTVFDRVGDPVAHADLANWRENARFEVRGTRYEARHETWAKEFTLEKEDGQTILSAEKPSAWRDRFAFVHRDNRYELKKESGWSPSYVLSRDGAGPVGSVKRKSFFNRELTADLPEELPLEAQVFVVWLVTILGRRDDSAAASSGAGAGS